MRYRCAGLTVGSAATASRTAASSACAEGRAASAARVAAKIVRCTGPSAMARTATPAGRGAHELGQQRHREAAGDEREAELRVVGAVADVGVEAAELAAGALRSSRSQPMPAWPVVHASPASSASGTAPRWRARRVVGGQDEVHRVAKQVVAVDAGGRRQRLVLPLVGEHEVDVAERERRQRLLGLGLDELAAQRGRVAAQRARSPGAARRSATDWKRGDPPAAGDGAAPPRRGRPRRARRGRAAPRRGDEHERRVGQPHAAAGALEQRHAGLALEHRRAAGRPPTGVNCSASATAAIVPRVVQLAEQAEPAEVEHRVSNATG